MSLVEFHVKEVEDDQPHKFELGNNTNLSLYKIDNANNLHQAMLDCAKGVTWKESTQRFIVNELQNIYHLQQSIENNTYQPKQPNEFILSERGKTRYIKASQFADRVVQKSFVDNVLLDKVRNKLIYDNGASLKNRGVSFSRARFENHARQAIEEYGIENVYILFIDFSKYFDNINHQIAINMLSSLLSNEELNFLINSFKEFEIDVSYMDENEYALALTSIFDMLKYNEYIHSNNIITNNKEKVLQRSVGIGNQLSQVIGVFYPHYIDNYCKIVKSLKYYGRYMDDTYIIFNSKQYLDSLLKELEILCKDLKLFINYKKTYIINIYNKWFIYLKIKYFYDINKHRLIRKPIAETFRREQRRLKKFKQIYSNGKILLEDIINCYKSWRGTYKKYDCGYELYRIDNLFLFLFPFVNKSTIKYTDKSIL